MTNGPACTACVDIFSGSIPAGLGTACPKCAADLRAKLAEVEKALASEVELTLKGAATNLKALERISALEKRATDAEKGAPALEFAEKRRQALADYRAIRDSKTGNPDDIAEAWQLFEKWQRAEDEALLKLKS